MSINIFQITGTLPWDHILMKYNIYSILCYRAISIGEVQNGKPVTVSVVTVRFTEMEANVQSIIEKVMLGLKTTESLVLTDAVRVREFNSLYHYNGNTHEYEKRL